MQQQSAEKMMILCVEESSTRRQLRRLILEQHGFEVLTAESAQQALAALGEKDVGLVMCDEYFGRDSGERLAAEVKRVSPQTPVLLIGGGGQNSMAADSKVESNVEPERLVGEVGKLLYMKPKVGPAALKPADEGLPEIPAHSEPETLKSLLAEIVEGSDDAILSKTLDGTVTSWNRAAEMMFGYSAKEMVGRNVTLLLPPDRPNEIHDILVKLQQGERITHFETKRKTKDGRVLEVSLTISPIRDSHGRIVGASTITRDITQMRQAERALRDSEKLAVAGRMAATVAHEINNPLEAISNIFYLLKQDKSLGEIARRFVNTGEEELRRIIQITTLTLGFHRDRQATMTEVNVPQLIGNALTLFSRKIAALGIRVETEYTSAGIVRGNSGELRQVFSNLIVNSIEALSAKGDRLRIRVRDVQSAGFKGIRVTIADNGAGIRAESRRRLFEPFFTTKGSKGTGIGLWVSRGIVSKHGGTIRLKSHAEAKKHGTVFSIFLPLEGPKAKSRNREPEPEAEKLRRIS